MPHAIIDAASIPVGRDPHPAASPYDRRISEALHFNAFEVYQVDLPPRAETVPHDHLDDRNDDVYAIIAGNGWIVVDDEPTPVKAGQFISVELQHRRYLRTGPTASPSSLCALNSAHNPTAQRAVSHQASGYQ